MSDIALDDTVRRGPNKPAVALALSSMEGALLGAPLARKDGQRGCRLAIAVDRAHRRPLGSSIANDFANLNRVGDLLDAPALVMTFLLAGLLLVLGEMGRALVMGGMITERRARPRIIVEWHVAAIAILLLLIYVAPIVIGLVNGERAREAASDADVWIAIVMNCVIFAAVLPLLAFTGRNRLSDFGIDGRGWTGEVRIGGLGYLVATPLVMAILVATSARRGPQNEHPFLQLLANGSTGEIIGIAVAAVVAAPLTEELIFRVLFQGLLESLVPSWLAVLLPASAFVAIHGRTDALPLFPLAIVLGIVYHWRRSYVAVVTIHAMFNATFLVLALRTRN
jgi:membrane protease YdiL (CAAX protease family)